MRDRGPAAGNEAAARGRTQTGPGPAETLPLRVVVLWDGSPRSVVPRELLVPEGRLATLPPDSLAEREGTSWLGEYLAGWAAAGPLVVLAWAGLPADLLDELNLQSRLLGRDRVAVPATAPTPLAAVSVGWRLAILSGAGPLDARHGGALAAELAREMSSLAVLARPGKAPMLELGGRDVARTLGGGRRIVRFTPRAVVSRHVAGMRLLDDPASAEAMGGGRLVLRAEVGSPGPVEVGPEDHDLVVDMNPGSLDATAWGQHGYIELAVSPRDVHHHLPNVHRERFCRGCERVLASSRSACDRCSLVR